MRTKYLAIVEFPCSKSDGEANHSAGGLYKKYSERAANPLFCSHYRVSTRSFVSKRVAKSGKGYRDYFPEEKIDTKKHSEIAKKKTGMVEKVKGVVIDSDWAQSDDVGVYLVFHCDKNGFPTIFDATHSQSNSLKMEQSEIAFTLAQVVVDLGLSKIRKIGLIACNTHLVQTSSSSCTFLEMFCGAAKGLFEHPPLIAGWDDYLSVNRDDGSKMIGNSVPPTKVTSALKKEHKFVARFVKDRYDIGGLEGSGWSDKNQLPTELGASSSF